MFEVNKESLKIYRDYQYERSSIYYKKEILGLPKPWTDDKFLGVYKFTNVNRRLDRESKFLIDGTLNLTNISLDDKLLNAVVFRCINSGEAVQSLLTFPVDFLDFKYNSDKYLDFEKKYWESNKDKKMQSNAYFLSGVRSTAYSTCKVIDKADAVGYNTAVLHFVLHYKDMILDSYHSSNTEEECCEKLRKIPSIGGPFMRYQIFVDWTYIPGSKFSEDKYVISGPGCNDGIDWMIHGNDCYSEVGGVNVFTNKSLLTKYPDSSYEKFLYWFTENLPKLMSDAGLEWNVDKMLHFLPEELRTWNLMQCENSYCELSKYMKLLHNIPMRTRYYR